MARRSARPGVIRLNGMELDAIKMRQPEVLITQLGESGEGAAQSATTVNGADRYERS